MRRSQCSAHRCAPTTPPRRQWQPRGHWAPNCVDSPSTSALGCLQVRSSPATSVRKTVTSTRLSGTQSTRRHGWRTWPRTSTGGCCVRVRRSSVPARQSDGAGPRRARRCCAAGPNRRRSPCRCVRARLPPAHVATCEDASDMRVDGRDITVSGSLLQPLTRRTNDILRLVFATALLAAVITSSLITRNEWVALEKSISEIVGVLTPTQSNLVYLVYGIAILALPFAILIGLIVSRQWKLLGAYAAAAFIAFIALSITGNGIAAPRWHFDLSERLDTLLSQFLDDPRWIAMLAAVLTVSGPWLPARWRRWWWTLLLAFVPIHLVASAVVPARSLLGLAVGWFVGALVVLVVGTPALEVPLDGAVRALARRDFRATTLTVLRPAGAGPLVLSAESEDATAVMELYGPHQRGGGALRQLWQKVLLRDRETAPLHASMRRAVEHRALMAIAI